MMSVALTAPSGHHGLGHGCFGLFGDEYHNDISNTDNPSSYNAGVSWHNNDVVVMIIIDKVSPLKNM